MRIAFFCPTVSGAGGVEAATRNLMGGFDALGDTTRLFLFGGSYNDAWLQGVAHTRFGSPADPRILRMAKYAFGAVRALAGWRPDAVICSDVTTMQMARLGRAAGLRPNTPIASWIHFPLESVRLKERLGQADLHLAISGQIAEDLQAYLPAQRDRVFTIRNAVEMDGAALAPRGAQASFLYVGRFTYDGAKRVNDLLSAVARLRGSWRLKLVGAAPPGLEGDGDRLRLLAAELGIEDRVEWLGWRKDPWAAAGEVTALAMPSAYEGFPMVLLEAAARGIVCVSSDCKSGPSEIIEPGRNGWLYPVGDVEKLAERLQSLVDAPQDLPPPEEVRATAERFSAPAIARRAREGILKTIARRSAR